MTLESIIAQIEAGYDEGQPLYIKDNRRTPLKNESVFKVISESEFIAMNQSDVQEILRKQHLVITDMRHREQNFEEALLGIASLDWVTGIQGKYVCFNVMTIINILRLKIILFQMDSNGRV